MNIAERYEELNERNKVKMRDEFCEKFKKTPDAFYKNLKGRTKKVKLAYVVFFADKFSCEVKDLIDYNEIKELVIPNKRKKLEKEYSYSAKA